MEPVTQHHWVPRSDPADDKTIQSLAQQVGVSVLLARILSHRQFSAETAQKFLDSRLSTLPDPFLLPNMQVAVTRLYSALKAGEKIAIHGDYDVDGITGTVLLKEVLSLFGGDVEYHIPQRVVDGYGLSAPAIENAGKRGVKLIVTVDCGVSAHQEARIASHFGIDLIITDHHQPSSSLPKALAVINPKLPESQFPFTDLSGVGVAFFLLIALRKTIRNEGGFINRSEPDLRHYLDLVALGTIADLVSLQGVNRTLTLHGLKIINRACRVGLRALKQVASVKEITSSAVGFQLAPRLNAVGRMEDATVGVELLLENDMPRALNAARFLDKCNRTRQDLEKKILNEAETAIAKMPDSFTHTIVLGREGWHPGVIGIVASRLVERYNRPTVLVALDGNSGTGSARSIGGYHMYQGLHSCAGHLNTFGGHEMAAGLSIDRCHLSDFAKALETHARSTLCHENLVPKLLHDGVLQIEEINFDHLYELQRLSPFGVGNPEPQMIVESVFAKNLHHLRGGHLRFIVERESFSVPAIAFGMQQRIEDFQGEIDLLVTPQINHYRGQQSIQLRIKDVRPVVSSTK